LLDDYRVRIPIKARFRDTDMLGHVNNSVYSTYLESGRLEYWAQLNDGLSFENWPFILARSEIDFLAEAYFGDELTLGVRVARLGNKSFDLEYLLVRDADERPIARGRSVQVMFDYHTKETLPISDETRALLEAFEGRALAS